MSTVQVYTQLTIKDIETALLNGGHKKMGTKTTGFFISQQMTEFLVYCPAPSQAEALEFAPGYVQTLHAAFPYAKIVQHDEIVNIEAYYKDEAAIAVAEAQQKALVMMSIFHALEALRASEIAMCQAAQFDHQPSEKFLFINSAITRAAEALIDTTSISWDELRAFIGEQMETRFIYPREALTRWIES